MNDRLDSVLVLPRHRSDGFMIFSWLFPMSAGRNSILGDVRQTSSLGDRTVCASEQLVYRAALFVRVRSGSRSIAMPEALLLGKAGITSYKKVSDETYVCDPLRSDLLQVYSTGAGAGAGPGHNAMSVPGWSPGMYMLCRRCPGCARGGMRSTTVEPRGVPSPGASLQS